jgi:hypothetical protein
LVLLFLFLSALLPASSTGAGDNKEVIDQMKNIFNVEPTPCQDNNKCYCYEITATAEAPSLFLPLRFSKAQYCPVEVRPGHILLAFKSWDKDGNKVDEGCFLNKEKDGLWTGWHPNGVKDGEFYYANGKLKGQFTTWHDNGQISSQGYHKDGIPYGEWSYWDKTGKLTKKVIWNNGKRVSEEEFK